MVTFWKSPCPACLPGTYYLEQFPVKPSLILPALLAASLSAADPLPKPHVTVEIEWGLGNAAAMSGSITVLEGATTKMMPIEEGNGITVTEARWTEAPLQGPKRRGLRLTAQPAADKPWALSLRTSRGNACVAMKDLERGPVFIPSLGLYLVRSGGPSAQQFRESLTTKKTRTARQTVAAAPEESHATAMAEIFGDNAKKLPAFPTPPYESPMQIEVPEQAITNQWRLGAWHLKRWCKAVGEDQYQVSIWRFRFGEGWDLPEKRQDYETTFAKARPTCIAQESHEIIRTMDLLGLHDVARGGLNFWLMAKEYAKSTNNNSQFTDFDGTLLTTNPGAGGPGYDMKHPTGHGLIMEAAALHYRMTRNKTWFLKVAPRLKAACEWTLRQRLALWQDKPRDSWGYGLMPPINFGDYGGAARFYMVSARFHDGLKSVATIMAELGVDGAADLLKRSEEFRKDIVAAVEESAALTPVVPIGDGTYRRYIPATPNTTVNQFNRNDPLMGFVCLADHDGGIYAPTDPLVRDGLDLIEQSIPNGITGQVGYEAHPRIYLLSDEIPLFLRSFYKEYAVLIRPWELEPDTPKNRKGAETPVGPAAYEFFEHPGRWAVDKTYEEAVFLTRLRNLLVMELGPDLWLARATPRAWLEQGKKITVKNAPTHFGTVGYEIVSDADQGTISATVQLPTRTAPPAVILRLRHPKAAPIRSVSVNGRPWNGFDPDKETITLAQLNGTVKVTAHY